MDDAEIEITLREMLKTFPREAETSVYHMVRKNGEVLETLRQILGFLSVMDRRLTTAANRVLDQKVEG